jgi:hypothetical protein
MDEYPMFPANEVIVIHDNVFIHKPRYDGSEYTVWFNVGVQYFSVGEPHDNREHAEWHANMLAKAIERLKKGENNG